MRKLNFPVVKGNIPAAKCLSMDDYLEFVTFNKKYILDKKNIRMQKRLSMPNIPFRLK